MVTPQRFPTQRLCQCTLCTSDTFLIREILICIPRCIPPSILTDQLKPKLWPIQINRSRFDTRPRSAQDPKLISDQASTPRFHSPGQISRSDNVPHLLCSGCLHPSCQRLPPHQRLVAEFPLTLPQLFIVPLTMNQLSNRTILRVRSAAAAPLPPIPRSASAMHRYLGSTVRDAKFRSVRCSYRLLVGMAAPMHRWRMTKRRGCKRLSRCCILLEVRRGRLMMTLMMRCW